eukprot:718109-Prorocentrum_minimum.AAC.2
MELVGLCLQGFVCTPERIGIGGTHDPMMQDEGEGRGINVHEGRASERGAQGTTDGRSDKVERQEGEQGAFRRRRTAMRKDLKTGC